MSFPILRDESTGEEVKVYWKNGDGQGARDDTVYHSVPARDGDITQLMGRGSVERSGTIMITDSMHSSGIEGYKQFLFELVRNNEYVVYIDETGTQLDVKVEEPDFDKSKLPNLLEAELTVREIDNPSN